MKGWRSSAGLTIALAALIVTGCGSGLRYSVQKQVDATPHASPEAIQIFRGSEKPSRQYSVIGTIESNRQSFGRDSAEMRTNFKNATAEARKVAAEMGGDAILGFMFYTGGMTAEQLNLPGGAGVYRGTVVRY